MAIACVLKALSRRFHCVHRVVTAYALRVHSAHTALTAFCLHSDVVEITVRVLISQLRHELMIVTMYQLSAFAQLCWNPKVTTHMGPTPSSSQNDTHLVCIILHMQDQHIGKQYHRLTVHIRYS